MIKVGFFGLTSNEWLGGINYLGNLLHAINQLDNDIQPLVFIGKKTDKEIKEFYGRYARVIEVSLLDRHSIRWWLWKLIKKITKSDFAIELFLNKFNLDVISHSSVLRLKRIKAVNWIPDFQHIHLPEMFSSKEIEQRNNNFHRLVKDSDVLILSSYSALRDFKSIFSFSNKIKVLRFVAQPRLTPSLDENEILKKHNITQPFFYLPNQFWKHKNHHVVFEALSHLKDMGQNVSLVCSGHLNDYRNADHVKNLKEYIEKKDIQIKILGLIDYEEVTVLMKKSIAVINPSLFEGWSTTVEECKSLGKNMILSDIPVHREQDPAQSIYFNPYDAVQLGHILLHYEPPTTEGNINNLHMRTLTFGKEYLQILSDITKV